MRDLGLGLGLDVVRAAFPALASGFGSSPPRRVDRVIAALDEAFTLTRR